MNKTIIQLLAMVLSFSPVSLCAQPANTSQINAPAHAPAGAVEIALYGKANPGNPADAIETRFMGRETVLRNITYPTLTAVLPTPGTANGTAVIVAPGGGFAMLAMENEGWRVAQALAARGVTAFVLKYRLNPTDPDDKQWIQSMSRTFASAMQPGGKLPDVKDPAATEDAIAALRMVRSRSPEWHLDPKRVGMIGFSAGAITTLNAVLQAPVAIDPLAGPPDFIGYIYGPMETVSVPKGAPPMFAALAMDDPLFGNGDWSLVSAWHAAKRPVELHVYQTGGHGFGLGKPGSTNALMMPEFLTWMDMQGLLNSNVKP